MQIPYRIKRIQTLQFAFSADKYNSTIKTECSVEVVFAYSINLDEIRCTMTFSYLQQEVSLLTAEIQGSFEIAKDGAEKLKKAREIPVDFLQYMASIVTGTARGIIHAKTEGTVLNAIVLPPINLTEYIKEPLQIEVE